MLEHTAGHNRKNGRYITTLAFRFFVFFAGLFIMAYGIALMITASLGLSPWDVLHMGLYKTLGLTIGTWSQLVGLLIIAFTYLLTKKRPTIGTLLNMIFVGVFTDIFLASHLFVKPSNLFISIIYLMISIVIMGVGAGMYISSRVGAGPRDGLMLELSSRLGWSIRKVKTVMEIIALTIGWLLGGPVFVGTLVFTITIGPIMQLSIQLFTKFIDWLMGREVVVNESIN